MADQIPDAELKEFLRRFHEATRHPWYYWAPWDKLEAVKTAYCAAIAFPLSQDPKVLRSIAHTHQAKESAHHSLPFYDYLRELHTIIADHPEDSITRCMLDFAATENFHWLNRQRKTPLHPRLAKIIEGLIRHYIHQQISLEAFLPEITVNWVGTTKFEKTHWLKRVSHNAKETWVLQNHETEISERTHLKNMALRPQELPELVAPKPSSKQTIRESDVPDLLKRFQAALGDL